MNLHLTSAATLIAIAALTACDGGSSSSGNGAGTQPPPPPSSTPAPPKTPPPAPPPSAPDNTGMNKRDAGGDTKTPMDQGNSASDIDITARIRKALMDDKSLSSNAQNCKIVTEKGVVTLRGTVDSQLERDTVEMMAKAVTGVVRVDNQIEVKQP